MLVQKIVGNSYYLYHKITNTFVIYCDNNEIELSYKNFSIGFCIYLLKNKCSVIIVNETGGIVHYDKKKDYSELMDYFSDCEMMDKIKNYYMKFRVLNFSIKITYNRLVVTSKNKIKITNKK